MASHKVFQYHVYYMYNIIHTIYQPACRNIALINANCSPQPAYCFIHLVDLQGTCFRSRTPACCISPLRTLFCLTVLFCPATVYKSDHVFTEKICQSTSISTTPSQFQVISTSIHVPTNQAF